MRTVRWLLLAAIVLFSAGYANAQAEEDPFMGRALVMVGGSTMTINTGLVCNQETHQVPTYEYDYKQIWLAIDNESYQLAFDLMKNCDSRIDREPEASMGMVNDFRLWLCEQPGLSTFPAAYFNGKFEDIAGDPERPYTPAWCLRNYGMQFLQEEFGIGTPSNLRTVKFYPRWETSGDLGLNVTFSNGRIVIRAPEAREDLPWMPPSDYNDISSCEEIYYVARNGDTPLVRFAVRVVPATAVLNNAANLPLVSNNLGEGYAVPLLDGNRQLVIPFSQIEPIVASTSWSTRSLKTKTVFQKASNSGPSQGSGQPISLPQFLRPVITPGYPPSRAGETCDTWNPPNKSFMLCKDFPKLMHERVIAIPHNTYYEIRKNGSKKVTYNDNGVVVGVEAPIRGIPTKAQIDVEVGRTQQMFADGEIGYYVTGPVWYNERKYQYYRIMFHWVSFRNSRGGYSWRLDWYQKQIKAARERVYLKHEWNGGTNENPYPFVATLNGWRSKDWIWIPPKTIFGVQIKAGHWELRPTHWPFNYGLTMTIWNGAGPGNPEGIQGEPTRVPPVPIYKEQ